MTQNVDTLFTNAFVLTMDETLTQYSPGAVAVKGDSIVAWVRSRRSEANIPPVKPLTAAEKFSCPG